MRGKCSNPECLAPRGMCIEQLNVNHPQCKNWQGNNFTVEKVSEFTKVLIPLPWTGEAFLPEDIEIVGQRSSPLIIGMVGNADAGKTSYLGMLYTLLFNGKKIKQWNFSGSYTLAAWESLAQYLKIKSNGKVDFPPPTPSNSDFYSLYHLALKNDAAFRDVLFADSSGEVFNLWSEDVHDINSENARWIYKNSNAFIFFVDSEALIEKRGQAKAEILLMAEQIASNLNDRPVVIVWSKSDRIGEIRTNIKESLEEDLLVTFKKAKHVKISNFPKADLDELCHINNLQVIEHLLKELCRTSLVELHPNVPVSSDLFLNYGRSNACQ